MFLHSYSERQSSTYKERLVHEVLKGSYVMGSVVTGKQT